MLTKLDEYFRFNETALHLRAQREEILSSNIANADTPNYKALDMDFNQVLQDRLAQTRTMAISRTRLSLGETGGSGSPPSATSDGVPLLYRQVLQASADGNTVEMDVERIQFAENSLHYQASVVLTTSQVKFMLAVLQG
ncbi:MAG: flagellar basal body rod protein FlgB [Candidatus Methylumidiphilus sp.]